MLIALLVLFVVVIVLGLSLRALSRRLARLEVRMASFRVQQSQTVPMPAGTPPVAELADMPELFVESAAKVEGQQVLSPERQKTTPNVTPNVVASRALLTRAVNWARGNWFYLVAAVSFALAGVFMVQYGVENGLLSPSSRVIGAMLLGALLVAVGELLRRRGQIQNQDKREDMFAYLPSTFAAGGLISLFSGVLAARTLYGLIDGQAAFAGLALVGLIAIAIGWFYGPLLAAIGILGAILAPFIIEGQADSAALLPYYFALIVVVALAVDTFKRWAWLSVFAEILGFVAAGVIFAQAGGGLPFVAFSLIVLVASVVIPARQLVPRQAGLMMWEDIARPAWLRARADFSELSAAGNIFQTRLVAGSFIAAALVALWVSRVEVGAFWLSFAMLLGMFGLAAIWMRHARAFGDLAVIAALALVALIWREAVDFGAVYMAWDLGASRAPEDAAPVSLLIFVASGVFMTLVAAWRSYSGAPYRLIWALGSAVIAPLIAIVSQFFWEPQLVLGVVNWSFYVLAIAVVMVVLTERFARLEEPDRKAAAFFVLAALTMISMALFLLLSASALTVSLAVMALAAVVLGRRFELPLLGAFAQVGAAVVSYRLIIDPGYDWATDASYPELIGVFTGTILLLAGTRRLIDRAKQRLSFAVVDSAVWGLVAVFAGVLIYRLIESYAPERQDGHAAISLLALVWLLSAANQLRARSYSGLLRRVQLVLAAVFGGIGVFALLVSLLALNPMLDALEATFGPYIFDSLFVAYAMPALVLLAVAVKYRHLKMWFRWAVGAMGAATAGVYILEEIRRFWRGDILEVPGFSDPELYTQTVVMLIISAALLIYSFYRRSSLMRKLALGALGVTVAKVFLVDMSGLTGLTRVFSFLVLGLVLAGLAWLDRWFGAGDGLVERDDAAEGRGG